MHMPIKVAILWHMHQPNYQEPQSDRMVLPWVRLHAIKDYLDMPLLAAGHESVRVTFNLVPALLDQLQLYVDGGSDRHLELSRMPAEQMSEELRSELLGSMFAGNPPTMIEPYPRYAELYRKYRNNVGEQVLAALFTSEELRDLQVWSNLAWVDPVFRDEEPVRTLMLRGRYFTEEQKERLLDWQTELISRVVPTYRDLFARGLIDVSFTPYYHPILPLLCDTESAKEAIPTINLPERRFAHPEDAEKQIVMAMEKFESIFGQPMKGMWPSEGSVSEEVAGLCRKHGLTWIATDEEVLFHSLRKSGGDPTANPPHCVYDHGPGLKMFFRDHSLSDRIGFVYSSWDPERAVHDLLQQIRAAAQKASAIVDDVVVPIILDGENAWEYYPGDGREFLDQMYRELAAAEDIETVTLTEAAGSPGRKLPKLFAGSWINHNFRIWIGHQEDNTAWDWLSQARETLVEFEKNHADYDKEKLEAAWRQIYIAEGSDWCWWYGDDHRGADNEVFDRIFRRHLIAVYELLGLDTPDELWLPIYRGETQSLTVLPDTLLTPVVDGIVSHFYEWAGAGSYDCAAAGGAMHRVDQVVSEIQFVYDHDHFYIRLDFADRNVIDSIEKPVFELVFEASEPEEKLRLRVPLRAGRMNDSAGRYTAALGQVFEVAVPRADLLPEGHGDLAFSVTVFKGKQKLETWPEGKPVSLTVYEKDKELFWP